MNRSNPSLNVVISIAWYQDACKLVFGYCGGKFFKGLVRVELKTRTQKERSGETRTKLKDAAVDIMSESGYASLTVLKIARRANVTTGAFMHHFDSKNELLKAVIEEDLSPITDRPTLKPISDKTLSYRCSAVVDHYWKTFGDPRYPVLWDILLGSRNQPDLFCHFEAHRESIKKASLGNFWAAFAGLELDETQILDLRNFITNGLRGLSLARFPTGNNMNITRQLNIMKLSVKALILSWKPELQDE